MNADLKKPEVNRLNWCVSNVSVFKNHSDLLPVLTFVFVMKLALAT